MNLIFSSLTTVSILTHSVFGCCWHHSHSCGAGHAEAEEAVVATVGDDGHACCVHGHHSSTSNLVDEDASKDVLSDNHSGHEVCEDSGCWMFSVARTDFTIQLVVATVTILQDDAAELRRVLFATGESPVSPWQKLHKPVRAMMQAWLL
jgi:hypothetical protein